MEPVHVVDAALPPLPKADTRSLAQSGRDVDYMDGYEAGFEACADLMRDYAREAIARYVRTNERAGA